MPALVEAAGGWRRGGRSAGLAGLDDAPIRGLRAQPRARGAAGLMPLPASVIGELKKVAGRDHVITAPNDLRIFERDGSIEGAVPDAIVLPSNTEQVAAVIKVAARHNIPIVPRGAGTGLSGGAVTIRGGIALQMTRMRRILEIDPVGQTALVEPGVVNQELSLAAAPHQLFYAPDPSSQKACTIGGNAAENSGGPHCLYYGVTTNHVLGMEVVLADGSVHWVSGDAADRIGLDLCGVLVGSEGTLCAITKVKVRLLRIPPSIATLLAAFPSIDAASQAVSAVIGRGIVPAALEMMDKVTVGAVEAHYRAGYPTDAGAVLLVEVDGVAESTRECARRRRRPSATSYGPAARAPSGPWGASSPTTTSTTGWCRDQSCRRCCRRSARSACITSCRSPTSFTPATATCTQTSSSTFATARCSSRSRRRARRCCTQWSSWAARSRASMASDS
ncbi:MAG: FAD-binding protein, partial [Chloroflexi bacterium]